MKMVPALFSNTSVIAWEVAPQESGFPRVCEALSSVPGTVKSKQQQQTICKNYRNSVPHLKYLKMRKKSVRATIQRH